LKPVNLISPTLVFSSFAYVQRITATWIRLLDTATVSQPRQVQLSTGYRFGFLNLRIDDLCLTLREGRPCDIAWLDTALMLDRVHQSVKARPARIFTCSQWDKEKAERLGVRVEGVVPRPFSPVAFMYRHRKLEKRYDVCLIGWHIQPDRKNFKYADELVRRLGLKAVAITNYQGAWERIDFSSIGDFEKFRLIANSKFLLHLSGAEGFGMPVVEAMAAGVPAIFLDRPAHNEFAVGYRIPVEQVAQLKLPLGTCESALPKMDEAVEVVEQALGEYGTERYEELSAKCIERADTMLQQFLSWLEGVVGR